MKHLAEEWADALEASTYFSVLKREGRSHDDFWRDFPDYDDLMTLSGYPGPVADRVCSLIPAGSVVLDIGAGTGAFTLPLARTATRVVALDPSPYHLSILERKADAAAFENIECHTGECRDIGPRWSGAVDYAVAAYSMIDPDIFGFLRNMLRAARIGIFLIYGAGPRDPLDEYAFGPRRTADHSYLVRALVEMGYTAEVEFFRRDYLMPFERLKGKYISGRRTEEELRRHLIQSGRLVTQPGKDLVRCTARDALVSVLDTRAAGG